MKVKRFQAPSMQEALEKVRRDMGTNALILSTRKLRKASGNNPLFEEFSVEVTAGLENSGREYKEKEEWSTFSSKDNYEFDEEPIKTKFRSEKPSRLIVDEQEEIKRLQEEMDLVKKSLVMFEHRSEERENSIGFPLSIPEAVANSYRFLRNTGVSDKTVVKIVNRLQKILEKNKATIPSMEMMLPIIRNEISVSGSIEMQQKPKVVALVGPTGVGKTTTIAKLAANYNLSVKKKVALFTLDTYRVAAVEQLKVYSQIMGIPMEVIEKTDDLERAFGRHQDKDLILIDTSGQSQKNKEQLIKLKTFLNVLSDVEVHLLLSATTSTETMDNIIQNFRFLSVDRLLFTKIDEGFIFGNILNVVSKYKIPVSYLTLGQNVPQDIEVANARKIAWLILYPEQKI